VFAEEGGDEGSSKEEDASRAGADTRALAKLTTAPLTGTRKMGGSGMRDRDPEKTRKPKQPERNQTKKGFVRSRSGVYFEGDQNKKRRLGSHCRIE